MFKPDLYQKSNSDTKRDALECLKKFGPILRWKEGCRVIDLGCGEGSLTVGVLREFLPLNFGQLVGADISWEMIDHANKQYGDRRTKFIVLDISKDIPSNFAGGFDQVFSFYALHWIQDQEQAFSNIYKLLEAGGQCLLLFVRYSPIQDFYRTLARDSKWKHWLDDVERYISPYREFKDPVSKCEEIMKKAGFQNIHVECEEKEYVYEEQHFRNTMEAICPFKIPADKMDEFMDEYMRVVRNMKLIHIKSGRSVVNPHYSLLVAYGTKEE